MNYSLKDLQNCILSIMIKIKEICEENNIQYILYGGTCLGAIRHKGFIPWDDDADFAMPRSDYNRFIDACRNGALGNDYYLQIYSKEDEPHYNSPWIRIRKNNTLCVIDYHRKNGFKHLGVFVDIFPFDFSYTAKIETIKKKNRQFVRINRFISNKLALKRRTIASKALSVLLLPIPIDSLLKIRNKIMCSLDVQFHACIYDFNSSYGPEKAIFPADLFESTDCVFENIIFKVPKKYDEMLKIMYGDYMTLPPKEKQIAHMPEEIKL